MVSYVATSMKSQETFVWCIGLPDTFLRNILYFISNLSTLEKATL